MMACTVLSQCFTNITILRAPSARVIYFLLFSICSCKIECLLWFFYIKADQYMDDACFVYASNANVECCREAAVQLKSLCQQLTNDLNLSVTIKKNDDNMKLIQEYIFERANVRLRKIFFFIQK